MSEDGDEVSNDRRPRRRVQFGQHGAVITAAVIGAVGTMAAAIATTMISLAAGDGASPAAASPSPSPTAVATAESEVPSDGQSSPGATASSSREHCRRAWQLIAQADVDVKPCIKRHADGFTVSVKVRPSSDVPLYDEVTVWVWLMSYDRELLASKEFLRTRDESALHACPVPLRADAVVECSVNFEPWDGDGPYTTSVTASAVDAATPPGWDNPYFAGTQAEYSLSPAP